MDEVGVPEQGAQGVVVYAGDSFYGDGRPTAAYLVAARENSVVRVVAKDLPDGEDPLEYATKILRLQLKRL